MKFLNLSNKIMAGVMALSLTGTIAAGAGIWVASSLSNEIDDLQKITTLASVHAHADMMHDALRADVISALASSDPSLGISLAEVQAQITEHSDAFRSDVAIEGAAEAMPEIKVAIEELAVPLENYISAAIAIVNQSATDINSEPVSKCVE